MKAAFLVSATQFEIRELPDPEPPHDGLVLKVEACGLCGSDLRRWKEGPPVGQQVIPGHEAAGIVVAVGDNHKNYRVGDRLALAPDVHCGQCYYCQRGKFNLCDNLKFLGITPDYPGGFMEKMSLTGDILENGVVHRMPQGMTFIDAALAEPCSSVLAMFDRTCIGLGDTVVVMGAGPIGCLHVVVARARGAQVILSEPFEIRRQMAQQFDPDWVLDPSSEDVVARVREITCGVGADAVICANPVAATQTQAVEMVRKGGKVILFGGLPKSNPVTNLDGNLIHYGEIEVTGAFSYHPTYHEMALDLINRKRIPSDRLITHTFNLEDIDQAFQTAAGGQALKVIVKI